MSRRSSPAYGWCARSWASAVARARLASSAAIRMSIVDASVVEDGRQPALRHREVHALAVGVVGDLVALHLADGEIARLRMREVETAHRGGRQHREVLGERDVGVPARV